MLLGQQDAKSVSGTVSKGQVGYSGNELEREHGNGHELEHGNGHELERGNGHKLELCTEELGR